MKDTLLPRIKPGTKIHLDEYSTKPPKDLSREKAKELLEPLSEELDTLQELLYGAQQHALLLVLQGLDTGGKDGAIRHLLSMMNPEGCTITSFKVPTPVELAHDFLWRVHIAAPERRMVGIWNRSHYEDVLIVRVHNLVPRDVWQNRYNEINNFEHMLFQNRTIIVKFFLNISKDEQAERLLDRENELRKAWKLNPGDWAERQNWDKYMEAYEDVLTKCNTEYAPWYIVPADKKWYRDLVIADTLVNMLRPYRDGWEKQLVTIRKTALSELDKIPAHNEARAIYDSEKSRGK